MSENLPTLHQPALPASPALANAWSMLYAPGGLERFTSIAEVFAASSFCPPALKANKADLLLTIALAYAIGESPLTMVQGTYVVGNRIAWTAQYMIARANGSRRFKYPIDWEESGTIGGDDYVVTAHTVLAATGSRISATISMATAKAEGWVGRNKKYLTLPQAMLRYRSATLLIRQYCPDILLGLSEGDELVDAGLDRVQSAADPAPATPPPASRPRADVLDATYEPVAAPDPASAAIDSSAPSLAAPPGSSAVASEGDGPVDPAEHQRLANAAMRALDTLSPDGRRRVREAAGVPHSAHLAKQPDAVLRAIPALATAETERERQRKALHHPSWANAAGAFHAALADLGTNYDAVAAFCERKGAKRPSAMDNTGRDKILARLRAPEVRAELGLPPLEAMPAAEPADEQPVREPGDENTDGGEE